ncbi:CNP1-like family protein [uncultured Ramlibacter sp.]|uniref:CNP1-like family protein n=1 Tax=uncultured Ramlibacter sp. TaxID=260755 RepID=UPI00261795AC|nr:CNP1-like family protein [uncultured Ramlibacter sp.]
MRPSFAAAALALWAGAALAQFSLSTPDPDWREAEAPPPPAVTTKGLIELDNLPGSSLRFGVDPASVTLGNDRVVRYVVVARSATGAVNAMYEGIRCSEAQVRTYARYNPDSGWVKQESSQWRPLHESIARHSLMIARTGACVGQGPNGTAKQIVRDLKSPIDRRFDAP